MTNIDLELLATVTGGRAANPMMKDMLHSVDVFADQLHRSSQKQIRALARCDYRVSEDRASGDPGRMARAEQTNCRDLLARPRRR